ncbi:patatin-like phospholipase family protein [candidate division KSB1 bacterium]|nr:patatin-like phospholipase family protein [candidate division KSB1 bacterium]
MIRSLVFWFVLTLVTRAQAETFALVLSGGGARGFAHIGVLKALEAAGLQPDLIVGSSMGAVVGGLYAAGYSAGEIEQIALTADWSGLFLDRPVRRNLFLSQKETNSRHILAVGFRGWKPEVPFALASGQKLYDMLFDLTQRAPYHAWSSFDDLKIPFRAVATDLNSGDAVVFRSGDLAEALRATVSIPLLFNPYRLDSLLLVDGGVAENIPIGTARLAGATLALAVDATSGLDATADIHWPWQLLDRVTTMMQIDRNAKEVQQADYVITPALGNQASTDFSGLAAVIDSGYAAALRTLPELTQRLRNADRPARDAVTFATRSLARAFAAHIPDSLSRRYGHQFAGLTAIRDSSLQAVPAGGGALHKLSLVRRMLIDDGFTLARVQRLSLRDSAVVSVWDEGRIGTIQVRGNRRIRPWMVTREFPLRAGETFTLRRARRGVAQLYGSELFESVSLATAVTDSGVHLTVRVTEPASPQLRFGVAFSSERRGRGFVEFLNDNVLNVGARLRVFGKYGERDEQLYSSLAFDRVPLRSPFDAVLASRLTTEFKLGWRREENNFYNSRHDPEAFYFFERSEADLAVGRSFHRWGELTYAARYESIRGAGVPDEPTARLAAVGGRIHIDTKDRYQYPSRGLETRARYEYVVETGANRRSYNRVLGFADLHVPLAKRTVIRERLDYGWNDRILPRWAQYGIGGPEQLLGLHYGERMGTTKLAALTELRYDLLSRWLADAYLSALYTVGAVSAESSTLPESAAYQHGVGACFGLATMLGPLKLTVGELLKSESGTGQTRIYLELGHDF